MESQLPLALTGAAVTAVATGIGALPALAAHRISERGRDSLMGFSAGVMLAASAFALIGPALALVLQGRPERFAGALSVGLMVLCGAAFLHICNQWLPHEHFFTGREGGLSQTRLKRIWLFVFAITLHNFPEGLAVGSGTGSHSLELALPILSGIALQDLPEGFVVAMALVGAGYSARRALGVAMITGLVEAASAMVGYFATEQVRDLLPWALAFAGGAMLYVVSDEMIPESHHKEHAPHATAGLMIGFVLMLVLDTALG
ncbi:MAG: ZIP family metal transporter [Oligoflexia bacterium]|nr:ZIP family metal transporter [Oligoflexia bacterium]